MKEGWSGVQNARKWCYFVEGRSLCGKAMVFHSNLEQGNDDSPDNCSPCKKKLLARKPKLDDPEKRRQGEEG